jgi:hypothetical protein
VKFLYHNIDEIWLRVTAKPWPYADVTRTALDFALSDLLNPEAKEIVFICLAIKHRISIKGKEPISREMIEKALQQFFGSGSNLIMAEFDKNLSKLTNTSAL